MTASTHNFWDIKSFIDENKLSVAYFNNDESTFSTDLIKIFPQLTKYYNMTYSHPIPIFPTMIELNLSAKQLNEKYDNNKEIKFYIQTLDAKFMMAETHKLTNKSLNNYVDVVMCKDSKYINDLRKYINNALTSVLKNKIYNFDGHMYYLNNKNMYTKDQKDLVGLDEYFDLINSDINTSIKYKEKLLRFGVSNGLNYILYGPPGTGKSSFVKALAVKLGVPVYVASLLGRSNENQLTKLLIPQDNDYDDEKSSLKIVLIEDFDRYLEINNNITMGIILNILDGVLPSDGVIRFFSANNPEIISENTAFVSRIQRTLLFNLPTVNQIKQQILNIYDDIYIDDNIEGLINKFCNYALEQKLSMRQITYFVCQYLPKENPIQSIVDNMEKYVNDLQQFSNYNNNPNTDEKYDEEYDGEIY